jgi:hypothetical protein
LLELDDELAVVAASAFPIAKRRTKIPTTTNATYGQIWNVPFSMLAPMG